MSNYLKSWKNELSVVVFLFYINNRSSLNINNCDKSRIKENHPEIIHSGCRVSNFRIKSSQ